MSFKHKKKLGQHFLSDKNIAKKIVRQANIQSDEFIWEIGPGKGILTNELLGKTANVTAFEIDKYLWPILQNEFGDKLNLIKEDVLKSDWNSYFPVDRKIKIVANLPYQITSPFLFKIIDFQEHFNTVIVMVQREVALRIKAGLGSKDYGILSLKMQFYFHTKYLFTVEPHVFYPPPRVHSAVISLIPRLDRPVLKNEKFFWKVVEASFSNRRKMLRNNLKPLLSGEKFGALTETSPIDLKRRGESLSEEEFIILYRHIYNLQQN